MKIPDIVFLKKHKRLAKIIPETIQQTLYKIWVYKLIKN